MGSSPHLWFCACKTVSLGLELQVSVCPRPQLCFLNVKQSLFDQNRKSLRFPDMTCRFVHTKQRDYHLKNLSLWVPVLICGFWMQNSDFWTRITSLYGSQTSCVVLCLQNGVIIIRMKGLYGLQPSSVALCMQNSVFMT